MIEIAALDPKDLQADGITLKCGDCNKIYHEVQRVVAAAAGDGS